VDLYSLAATYIRLRTGREPFGTNPAEIIERQKKGEPILEGLEEAEKEFLRAALDPEPEKRFSKGVRGWVQGLYRACGQHRAPVEKPATSGIEPGVSISQAAVCSRDQQAELPDENRGQKQLGAKPEDRIPPPLTDKSLTQPEAVWPGISENCGGPGTASFTRVSARRKSNYLVPLIVVAILVLVALSVAFLRQPSRPGEQRRLEVNTKAPAFGEEEFLSGSEDSAPILWDVATGQKLRTFQGHSDSVSSVDSKTKEPFQQSDALAAKEQSPKDQRVVVEKSPENPTREFEQVKKELEHLNAQVSDPDTQLTNIKKLNDALNEDIKDLRRRGTLIYFVHTSELQESVFHSIWQELDQELAGDRELLVCRAQEGNTLVAVYPEDRSLNTPAAEASRRVTPETFKQAVNEAREHFQQKGKFLGKIIVICDDRFLDQSKNALEAPQHYGDALPPAVCVIALQLSQTDQSSIPLRDLPTGVFIYRRSLSQGNQKEDLKDAVRSALSLWH
jgi:hypothetical protein